MINVVNVPALYLNAVMDPHNELMNSAMSHMDTLRTNWILLNEIFREANNKIVSLEAELLAIKNQLQYTVYKNDILNRTLFELRKILADCEVIDNIQKNEPSFITTVHQSSVSKYSEEQANIQRNTVSLTIDKTDKINPANLSEHVPNLLNARSKKSIELSSNVFTRISNKYIHKVLDVNVKGEIEKKSSRSMNTIDDIFIPSDNVYVEGEDSDSTSNGCAVVSNAVHLKNEIDLSKSNESIEPTIDSKDDYQEDECHLSNSNGLTVVGSNGHAEHENGVLTNSKEQVRPAGDKQAYHILNTQNLFCSDSNEHAGLITAAHIQDDLLNSSAQSLIRLNAGKHADFIDSSDVRVRVENNCPILSDPKSVSRNLENKFPIVLISQLSLPNEISQNKKVKSRKRKNLKAVKSDKKRNLRNSEKIEKSHPSVSSASESHSQDSTSSPSSSKVASDLSKSVSKNCFWKCSVCEKKFSRGKHLLKHANQAHSCDQKIFACELCKFTASNLKSLQEHVETHVTDL